MLYWFLYDNTTGIIQQPPIQAASNPWLNPPASWSVASFATTDTTAILAAANPAWYLVQSGALVIQPHWIVTATASTTTTGEYSLSATLENAPASPPTQVTFTVAGGTISATVTSNQATATIQLHETLSAYSIPVTVSATGTVSGSASIGGNGSPPIGTQLVTSGSTPLVAPAGAGSRAFGRAYYLGLSPQTQIEVLTEALQDLYNTDGINLQILWGTKGILAALTSGASPLMTLDPETANLMQDIQANLIPNLPFTLEEAYPTSGGTRNPLYQSMVTMAPTFQQGALGYVQYLSLPNLA